jgi:hypothetical protein
MSFVGDINRFATLTGQSIDQAVRNTRQEAVRLVMFDFPVKTGQARGSVIAAIGAPADSPTIFDNTSGTSAAIARAQGAINAPSNNIFYFTTNLPYVKYLEDGSSTQAPSGMFKISAIQLREGIRTIIQNAAN